MRIPARRVRPRREDGFGLVELVIAMTVLGVAILALVAAYSSGYVALGRATSVSAASVLADAQMERYRALQYTDIMLNTTSEDATYQSDAAYSATAEISGCTSTDPSCTPTQSKSGPDGKTYRIDTYIDWSCVSGTLSTTPAPTCGSGQPAPVKLVTVVVRKSGASGDWVREQSAFDDLTGS